MMIVRGLHARQARGEQADKLLINVTFNSNLLLRAVWSRRKSICERYFSTAPSNFWKCYDERKRKSAETFSKTSSQTIGLAIAILGKEDWYQAYHNPIGMQIKLLWKSHGLFWHFQRVKEQTKKPIRNDE